MKIMQILPAMQGGGVERGTIEIANALVQAGVDNVVVSKGGRLTPELEKIGVKHITLDIGSKNPFVFIRNIGRLRKIIQQEKVTILHARSRIPAWVAHFALKKCPKVHFMTTFHGQYGTSPKWFKIPYNRIMVSGECVISISNFISEHILKNYKVAPEKIKLIYRGADINKFNPYQVNMAQVADLSEKWQVPSDKPVILMPCRLSRQKGHLVVLEALSLMKNKDVACLFVGSDHGKGDYHKELQQKINALDTQTKILLKDHCDNMPVAYMLSDIVLSASLYPEAFGRTIPEAQAMGRIVVGTNHGGATETIEDGVTGFLVPVGDAKALAEKLDEILQMSLSERKKMADAAEKSVRERFSIQNMCDKTLAVYRELSK